MSSALPFHDRILIRFRRVRLVRRNERTPDVGEVGAGRDGRGDAVAAADGARQRDGAVPPLAHLLDERKGRQRPRVAARAPGHQHQTVRALLDRLRANLLLMTSWNTRPPYECTASLISGRAPSDVMTMGTSCLTMTSMSCSKRGVRPVHDLVDHEGRVLLGI